MLVILLSYQAPFRWGLRSDTNGWRSVSGHAFCIKPLFAGVSVLTEHLQTKRASKESIKPLFEDWRINFINTFIS